ncbi:MAG: nucleotidyl transferase AbiEii/AbiGii toxin family protein [Bacteroidetes bacterium]|nr:nucleotidyl transferase AbiEii/AbiGii toxin family protein [Bacteroidota bacterium]MBU1719232.1 nucleotidyl transferase AbiEii/AbiGii toxin family protein [Bacteroidota bacterium]
MIDINRHKLILVQLLRDIYENITLANHLGFKGDTALMLFYDLPRFSVDLDFNLTVKENGDLVYESLRKIVLKYGRIKDEAKKHFGSIIVLDCGENTRNLKIEVSNRMFEDTYEIKDFLGIKMKVMIKPDMFAHKLCALLDRRVIANRDIFDCYYFLESRTPINKNIVETRMSTDILNYFDQCVSRIEKVPQNRILSGIGDLVDEDIKHFVRNKLKPDTISLLKLFRQYPVFS